MRKIVYLIRHAQSVGNAAGISEGRSDSDDLTPLGIEQAKLLRAGLARADVGYETYSSPVRRAVSTAKIISLTGDVGVMDDFTELELGEVTNKDEREILKKDPDWQDSFFSRENAYRVESFEEVYYRMTHGIEKLIRKGLPERVAIVTHADCVRSLLSRKYNIVSKEIFKVPVDNASVTILSWHGKGFEVLGINVLPMDYFR